MSPSRKRSSSRTQRPSASASNVSPAERPRSNRRALLSVADKEGLAPFALALESLGFEILTTVPEAFDSRTYGRVGLHIMYQRL